jgi:hypothetical protein
MTHSSVPTATTPSQVPTFEIVAMPRYSATSVTTPTAIATILIASGDAPSAGKR